MRLINLLRRLAGALAAILVASFLAFAILEGAPGDAAALLAGEGATAQELSALRDELGLTRPLWERYAIYLTNVLLHGDFGASLLFHRPVGDLIGGRFLSTCLLAASAICLASLLGVLAGGVAASRAGKGVDIGLMALAALGMSLPSFVLALALIEIFALRLGALPVAGGGDWQHLLLPALTLALPSAANLARLSRAGFLEASTGQHVLAARARGLPAGRVWRRYVLRNALASLSNLIGLNFGHLLGGAFIVETIFGWPGLGRLVVQAIFAQDFPVILGATILLAVIYQIIQLVVDWIQGHLDPRVGANTL